MFCDYAYGSSHDKERLGLLVDGYFREAGVLITDDRIIPEK